MNLPRLGLFTRLFALYGATLALLTFAITALFWVISEDEALRELKDRHDTIVERFTSFANGLDLANRQSVQLQIARAAEEIKGDISVQYAGERQSTSPTLPSVESLTPLAVEVGQLHYAKYAGDYYLMYSLNLENASTDVSLIVTSAPVNRLVYAKPWVYWPWLLILLTVTSSYLILRRWFRPVANAVTTLRKIREGDLQARIHSHPSNELAELTRGINQMAAEVDKMVTSKNQLLLATSHELRTPLARMRVSLALLEDSERARELQRDVQKMSDLIEQLLEGERLQSGEYGLHFSRVYLPMFIAEVMREEQTFQQVLLVTAVPEIAIQLDVGRIKFLLRNLLTNAIKHNPAETDISLNVSVIDEFVEFKVCDQGAGISEEALSHLFEPFYRCENVFSDGNEGTGLGLYLCSQIAEAHGGILEVSSTLGEGTCFKALILQNDQKRKI